MGFLLILIIAVIIFFIKINLPAPGEIGERRVKNILSHLGDEYIVMNDIILQSPNGYTSQIDHLVLSEYGIIVIETKNYKGWIFGNEQSEEWQQVLFDEKYFFRNPVKQNWSHIYTLKSILTDFHNLKFFPIVVFSGSADLMDIKSSVPVIYAGTLLTMINYYSCEKCLSNDEVQQIKTKLETVKLENKISKDEHIKNIRQSIREKELKKANLICPKCNGQLILREGKYGYFYGCSNYPNCKFTMKY